MNKLLHLVPVALSLAGLAGAAQAVNIDINVGTPAPVYVAPPPVYVQPAPVYVPPPVRVVAPGWYGERYYDGHRYWSRQEWDARGYHGDDHHHHHHEDERYHCPPGHAKKGEC